MYKKDRIAKEKELGVTPGYQYDILQKGYYFHSNWFNNKLVLVSKFLKFSKNMRVLDLGCGSGIVELEYAKSVKQFVAIDHYSESIKFLNKKLKERSINNVKTMSFDLLELDKRSKDLGLFDIIIFLDVIEHLS